MVFVVLPARGAKRAGGVTALALECGVPAIPVDADDAVAIFRVAQESIGRARIGGGVADTHTRSGQNSYLLNNALTQSSPVLRIFRVQAHLDGMTGGARRCAFKVTSARDVNLKFHKVESGRGFG